MAKDMVRVTEVVLDQVNQDFIMDRINIKDLNHMYHIIKDNNKGMVQTIQAVLIEDYC